MQDSTSSSESASAKIWEQVFLGELFGGPDPRQGLMNLKGLASAGRLSEDAVAVLVEEALTRPRRDPVRHQIWEVLAIADKP